MTRFPPPDLLRTCNDPLRIHERRGRGPCVHVRTCGCQRFRLSFRMVRRWLHGRLLAALDWWYRA